MSFYICIFIFLALFTVSVNAFPEYSSKNYITYSVNLPTTASNIAVSKEANAIYVGAKNRLLRLDKNLVVLESTATGPDFDHSGCNPNEICEHDKPMTDSVNKLLLVEASKNRIISCSTLYQGSCESRDWKNISHVLYNSKDYISKDFLKMVCLTENCSTHGLISAGFTVGEPVLYIGTTLQTESTPVKVSSATLAIYSLHHNPDYENKLFRYAITSGYKTSYYQNDGKTVLDIKYMFETGNYTDGHVYYVMNYREVPYIENSELVLARICKRDTSFLTYVELQIDCSPPSRQQNSLPKNITIAVYEDSDDKDQRKLYVGVHHDGDTQGQSSICTFNMTEIEDKFLETLEACWYNDGVDKYGNEIVKLKTGQCRLEDKNNDTEVDQHVPLELDFHNGKFIPKTSAWCGTAYIPKDMKNTQVLWGKWVYSHHEAFLSILVDNENDVLFIGTDNGHLLKVNLQTMELYSQITFEETIIKHLSWSLNSINQHPKQLVALTPNRVLKIKSSACETFTNCESCTKSKDPYCGWCTLMSKCTLKSKCLSNKNEENSRKWLNKSSDKCFRVNKDLYTTHNDPEKLDFEIQSLPIPEAGKTYSCLFDGKILVNASIQRNGDDLNESIICDSPPSDQLPRITSSDHVNVSLEVVYDGNLVITETHVAFYNCQQYGRDPRLSNPCKSCLTTRWNCSYDVTTHSCSSSKKAKMNPSLYLNDTKYCPQVQINKKTNKFIPVDFNTSIYLTVKHIPLLSNEDQLMCSFILEEKTFTTSAIIVHRNSETSETMIRCEEMSYGYTKEVSELNSSLKISWKENQTIDFKENIFTFYKCSVTRDDCSKCLSTGNKYGCGWCSHGLEASKCSISEVCSRDNQSFITNSNDCSGLQITGFSPRNGPVEGGTMLEIRGKNMGASPSEVRKVLVAGIECKIQEENFLISVMIVCETRAAVNQTEGSIEVFVREESESTGSDIFKYQFAKIGSMSPQIGPKSGGTLVKIRGTSLDIGRNHSVYIRQQTKQLICKDFDLVNGSDLSFKTPEVENPVEDLEVYLHIDNAHLRAPLLFTYKPDPQIDNVTTLSEGNELYSILSGGRKLYIHGKNFISVPQPRLRMKIIMNTLPKNRKRSLSNQIDRRLNLRITPQTKLCETLNDSMILCHTPSISDNSSFNGVLVANLTIEMDNFHQYLGKLHYVEDPKFTIKNSAIQEFNYLHIDAEQLDKRSVAKSEVKVLIGEHNCVDVDVSEKQILCNVSAKNGDRNRFPLTVHIGNRKWVVDDVSYYSKPSLSPHLKVTFSIVGVIIFLIVLTIIIILIVKNRNYRANKNDYRHAIDNLEQSVRADFRKAFAELSIEMSDLTTDVFDTGIPCLDYRSYVSNLFFPSHDHHMCMRPPTKEFEEGSKGLRQFHELLFNPTFLSVLVETWEEQRQSFTTRDKAYVASLLTVALHHDLDYFTRTVKELVMKLIERNLEKNPKLIFRRNDSIADRCLSNWLYITLYPTLRKKTGKMIFMLLKAIKQQVSKGPLDAVSGKAMYTLSDDRLLKEDIPNRNLTLFIKQNCPSTDDEPAIVKVLSCDSVAQVKEKVMDVVYKRLPFSQRPRADELDLEWHNGRSGQLVLPIDGRQTERNSRWSRLYTISDYRVESNATLALVAKQSHHQSSSDIQDTSAAPSVHSVDTTVLTPMLSEENGTRLYHLVKCTDETEQNRQSSINRDRPKYIPEIYLLRLINMKGILQKYVQDVINSIFDEKQIPLPVRYLFDFLDNIAATNEITDPSILHLWKTNSLPCKFWVTILKNPEYVFDIEKPDTISSSMAVITQTFIDACAVTEQRPTKDSPINKQLYAKEIPTYMAMVQDYYKNIKESSLVPEIEMKVFLDNIQQEICCELDVDFALSDLWPYVNKYYDEIIEKMDEADALIMADAKQLLMQTYNLMEHGSNTESS